MEKAKLFELSIKKYSPVPGSPTHQGFIVFGRMVGTHQYWAFECPDRETVVKMIDKLLLEDRLELSESTIIYSEGRHGHVTPRADGMKARCGGPGLCDVCSQEYAREKEKSR